MSNKQQLLPHHCHYSDVSFIEFAEFVKSQDLAFHERLMRIIECRASDESELSFGQFAGISKTVLKDIVPKRSRGNGRTRYVATTLKKLSQFAVLFIRHRKKIAGKSKREVDEEDNEDGSQHNPSDDEVRAAEDEDVEYNPSDDEVRAEESENVQYNAGDNSADNAALMPEESEERKEDKDERLRLLTAFQRTNRINKDMFKYIITTADPGIDIEGLKVRELKDIITTHCFDYKTIYNGYKSQLDDNKNKVDPVEQVIEQTEECKEDFNLRMMQVFHNFAVFYFYKL